MEVIYLQVFVSLGLVVGSLLLFAYSTRQRDMDHVDRMALFPMDEEPTRAHEAQLKGQLSSPGES
jgi:hypothetical protein